MQKEKRSAKTKRMRTEQREQGGKKHNAYTQDRHLINQNRNPLFKRQPEQPICQQNDSAQQVGQKSQLMEILPIIDIP